MQSRTNTSSRILGRGFTIVELITVIIALSVLATIAVTAIVGYQPPVRDRERKADIATISRKLERYYRTNAVALGATYPPSTVGASGLTAIIDDEEATTAPDDIGTSIVIASSGSAQTPSLVQYIYQPLNINGSRCTSAPCVKYKLFYRLEVSNTVVTQNSLRQQ